MDQLAEEVRTVNGIEFRPVNRRGKIDTKSFDEVLKDRPQTRGDIRIILNTERVYMQM